MSQLPTNYTLSLAALLGLATACSTSTNYPTPRVPATDTVATDTAPTATEQPTEQPVQQLAFPEEPWRNDKPKAGEPRPFQLPGIQQFTLDNGVQVYLVERHELPTVQVHLAFDGGSINDARGKEGMASVCMAMMAEGTESLNKIAFAEAQADIASNVGAYAGAEQQGITMSSLTKHLDRTLDLWADMMFHPGFRQEDMDRLVARRKESLKQAKGSASSVIGRISDSIAYGPAHPFGRMTTDASYDKLTIKDCQSYPKTWLKPKGARLFIVGDMTEAQIRDKVGSRLAGWKGTPRRSSRPGRARPRKGTIFFVDVPKSAQSGVYMGHLGPKRTDKDFFATMLMARVLGGGFASRINMNLREEKGWAYGARGGFSYTRNGSVFSAGGSFHTEHTKGAMLEVRKEILQMQDQSRSLTPDELAREQQGALQALPGSFATARQVLQRYQTLIWYGLPFDYYTKYVDAVGAITPAQVVTAAKKHLQPRKLQVLVAGDGEQIMSGLLELTADKAFGGGNLVILNADGEVQEQITPKQAAARLKAMPAPAKPADVPVKPAAPATTKGGKPADAKPADVPVKQADPKPAPKASKPADAKPADVPAKQKSGN